jgi:hypothetical protein
MSVSHPWLSEEQIERLKSDLPTDTWGQWRVWRSARDQWDRPCAEVRLPLVGHAGGLRPPPNPSQSFCSLVGQRGVWTNVFHTLASAGRPPAQGLVNSSAIKVHRCAAGGEGGSVTRPLADPGGDDARRSIL